MQLGMPATMGDGVTNGQEITDGTNPLECDTDGDGVTDGKEKQITRIQKITVH
jgi:hypothetical protein